MANYEVINILLKDYILEKILPREFQKHSEAVAKNNAYMVIIGGVSVEMCAKMNDAARAFLKNIFTEDIDVKFIVENEAETDLDMIRKLRMLFLKDVISSMKKFVKKHHSELDPSVQISLFIDESRLASKHIDVLVKEVVSISVEYVDAHANRIKYSVVDTAILSPRSFPDFSVFKKTTGSKLAVPYYIHNNVNFATCEYMLYDNCRMLIDRAHYLKDKKSLFALLKFIKYVIKFMCLYIIRKKIAKLPPKLNKIYEDAYEVLQKINTVKIKNGFKQNIKIKYDNKYIEKVISSLDVILKAYDMKTLIKATVIMHAHAA